MNNVKLVDRDERMEVSLVFSDSRYVDVYVALGIVCQDNKWTLNELRMEKQLAEYDVFSGDAFLASLRMTYGWEPPTRVLIENKPATERIFWPAARRSTVSFAIAFVEECGRRGLLPDRTAGKALTELREYDLNIGTGVTTHG